MNDVISHMGLKSAVLLLMTVLAMVNLQAAVESTVDKPQAVAVSFSDKQHAMQVLRDKWGVELLFVRSTAAGHMLDFRYRVLDPVKSVALFERETKPYLIHQKTGKVLAVPNTAKVGPLRNSDLPKIDRNYWMFFQNYHQLVNKGDQVTVVIGEFRVENIPVE